MLGRKRILMIGNEGVVLFGPSLKGGVEREASLSWELPDFDKKLVEALQKKNEKKSVLVLYDGSDNAFRKETNLPKLGSMDRAKYIKRKLDQVFSNYPVRMFLDVTPKKGADGEKPPIEYLFVAITEMDRIDRVADSLLESGVHVSGVCILPIESESLIQTLEQKVNGKASAARWIVLAGQNEDGGLRQVIVKDGNMAFTRIIPTSEAGVKGEAWANEFIAEFKATETYLTRLNYKPEEGLSIIMICGEEEKNFFAAKEFSPGDSFKCLTAEEALKLLGFKHNLIGDVNYSDSIYAGWMSKKSGLKLPVSLAKISNIKWPRIVASVTSLLMMLGIFAISYFAFRLYEETNELDLEIDKQRIQQRMLQKEYDEESVVFNQFPIKMEVVKGTVAVNDFLKGNVFKMTPLFNVLRAVLPKDIKLAELEVKHKSSDSGIIDRIRGRGNAEESSAKTMQIIMKYSLVKSMPLEEKVLRAENLLTLLKGRLPGYQIKLDQQFGNVSRDEGFSGKSDEKSVAERSGASAEYSIISIEGPAL